MLLLLPTACNMVGANITECPKLLNLAPDSPSSNLFKNVTSAGIVKLLSIFVCCSPLVLVLVVVDAVAAAPTVEEQCSNEFTKVVA
ncbi:hypothetical protein GIB67_040401 [Kingdonia uniflora]|uniref:Uncharacterized protein n=1 Tax=Kingdonia uniflora TaxID=39325 RepID=A0A7J7KXI7_9MAGN|nr:hypothetical protein GIB67_040401 [Kingdonia uniflora]